MRITNSMIYDSVIRNTNNALERYYALSEQNSSLRKINSPSDDPNGTGQVLGLRDSLRALEQYQENIDTATAWLAAADSALQQVSDLVTHISELAEQGATGTLTAAQRLLVAQSVREDFEQLLGLANSEYADQSIFAGQRTDSDAYAMVLSADLYGSTLSNASLVSVSGDSDSSVLVQFTASGAVGADAISYRYSTDGGETWTESVLAAGDTAFSLGSCSVSLASGAAITGALASDASLAGGSDYLVVRPAAVYLGNGNDGATVAHYGAADVTAEASGSFSGSVLVRIDADAAASNAAIYSYSTDNGASWVTGNTADDFVFAIPGGALELTLASGAGLAAGEQFVVTPYDADLNLAISPTSSVTVNSVGKDIFGGLYQAPGESSATATADPNLLESVGRLIGALETNDTDVIGQCLAEIRTALATVEKAAASIGARESRLEYASAAMTIQSDNQTAAASAIEDVDSIALMVKLKAAETVYKSVVETSSIILELSLVNYL
jgi:flagellar hook-associated protein 3 FlgL